ncbi:MAG: DUF1080 domain-containing protein [bacterium]
MKSRFGTIIIIIFLVIGIGGMLYFNFQLFNAPSNLQEIPLDSTTTTPQADTTPSDGEIVPTDQETPIATTAPVTTKKTLYENNFSSPATLASDFELTDTGNIDKPGVWSVKNGELVQTSNIWGGTYGAPIAGKQFFGTYALLKNKNFDNFDMQVTMRSDDNDGMGILFRANSTGFYRILAVKDPANGGPFLMLDKQQPKNNKPVFSSLKTNAWEFEPGTAYTMKVQANDKKIKVWINDKLMFDVDDLSITSGTIGLYSFGQKGLYFSNLKITEVGGLASSAATTATDATTATTQETEANIRMEKVEGTVVSRTGNQITIKTTAGKTQRVQIIDETTLLKGSATGAKGDVKDLTTGKTIEISGNYFKGKLADQLLIAESIIIKS